MLVSPESVPSLHCVAVQGAGGSSQLSCVKRQVSTAASTNEATNEAAASTHLPPKGALGFVCHVCHVRPGLSPVLLPPRRLAVRPRPSSGRRPAGRESYLESWAIHVANWRRPWTACSASMQRCCERALLTRCDVFLCATRMQALKSIDFRVNQRMTSLRSQLESGSLKLTLFKLESIVLFFPFRMKVR